MVNALSGLGAWVAQRLSALYMLLYLGAFATLYAMHPEHGAAAWQDTMTRPVIAMGGALFMAAVLLHTWVGVRDVIIDYVHPVGTRFALLVTVGLWLSALGVWGASILLAAVLP